jgi:hypothetical protein
VGAHYELVIRGEPGELLRAAFADVDLRPGPGATILTGDIDAPALHALLARIGNLGLELVSVQQIADAAR